MDSHRRWVAISCLSAYFMSIAMLYQMCPFFLDYAEETAGASAETVGLIFAALPAGSFLFAVPAGRLVSRIGPPRALSSGLVLLAGSTAAFGLSGSVPAWLLWRFVQGIATAPVYCAISTTLAQTFTGPGEFSRVNGYQEIVSNLGFTVGPMLGGALFQWGGFQTPFFVSAVLHLFFVGLSCISKDGKSEDQHPQSEALLRKEDEAPALEPMSASSVCFRSVLVVAGVTAITPGAWAALEPVLATHFTATLGDISSSTLGVLIALPAVSGALAAIVVPKLSEVFSDTSIIVSGYFIFSVGLLGFSVPLPGDSAAVVDAGLEAGSSLQWLLQLAALLTAGFGFATAWTPCLPALMERAVAEVSASTGQTPEEAVQRVSSPVSAVFNAFTALGEGLGPIVGGALVKQSGFDGMALRITAVLVGYSLLLLLEKPREELPVSAPSTPTLSRQATPQVHFRAAAAVARQ